MAINPETQTTFETLRALLSQLTPGDLRLLKQEVDRRVQEHESDWEDDESDWLDTEYMEQLRRETTEAISLEEARAILAKIPGSLSDFIIAEREDRV